MKVLKFLSIAIGAVAIITGFDSCKKDSGIECCSFTYEDYSVRACDDGTYSYTFDGTTTTGNWTGDFDSWTELKNYMVSEYNATCK